MNGASKFVTVILVLAAFVSPVLALTVGWTGPVKAADSGQKCPHDCPTMTRCAEAKIAGAVSTEGSCCQISSGKPAPAAVPQLPVNPAQAHPVAEAAAVDQLVVAQPQKLMGTVECAPPDVSPQAVLCTFLI